MAGGESLMAGRTKDWSRRYPPLLMMIAALVLALFALPSALNLPQANPAQTLEYAPVPGDQGKSTAGGNLAGLGLGLGQNTAGPGSAEAVASSLEGTLLGAAGLPLGGGTTPSTKQCVGNPPRQTEDPLAPPCVAFFTGDNGGATYEGVTRTEIRTLFAYEGCDPSNCGGYGPTSRGNEYTPPPGYYDIDALPSQYADFIFFRVLRVWETYFNARFQTYNRHVHFLAYITDGNVLENATARKSQAADNIRNAHPFTVFPRQAYAAIYDYAVAMAQGGVLNFGSNFLPDQRFFDTNPKRIWGFAPPVEGYANLFSSYVCAKVKPYNVSFSGNRLDKDKPRKYGLIYSDESPAFIAYARTAEAQLTACGVDFGGDRIKLDYSGGLQDTQSAITLGLAKFRQDGVTTVLWAGGRNLFVSQQAGKQGYDPEWVLAGDRFFESDLNAQLDDQTVLSHAWVVTPQILFGREGVEQNCASAARSIQPAIDAIDMTWHCGIYHHLRQYFTGIQVAGPHLVPDSIDQGFRAIPPHASTTPEIPACYYPPGSYTCVKDAVAEWWDPNGGNADSKSKGCWRAIEGGRRFLPGTWPGGDVLQQKNPAHDPCNTFVVETY